MLGPTAVEMDRSKSVRFPPSALWNTNRIPEWTAPFQTKANPSKKKRTSPVDFPLVLKKKRKLENECGDESNYKVKCAVGAFLTFEWGAKCTTS